MPCKSHLLLERVINNKYTSIKRAQSVNLAPIITRTNQNQTKVLFYANFTPLAIATALGRVTIMS